MKTIFCAIIAAALGFLSPIVGRSQTCEKGIYVFFANGIDNSRLDAASSMAALRARVVPTLPDSIQDKLHFRLAYNDDNLLFGDFIESFGQWDDELDIQFIRWLRGLGSPSARFTNAYNAFIRGIDALRYVSDGDLQRHVEAYRELLDQGHKVIVVSHSQGNFYANSAHRIVNSNSLGITAVATPASVVEGGGQHTTLVGDFILLVPGSLPANLSNPTRGDLLNHGFTTSYMSGAASSNRIVALTDNLINSLPFPDDEEVGKGIITVRLTWGSQPDVDLHVYEPGGDHVYYSHLRGTAGYLDVDDVSGFGPEHYYVSCETLQEGTYQVGVNYYFGDSPATAQVQVSAGPVVRNYSRTLPDDRGSDGDNSPVPVATISVTRDSRNQLEFNVAERSASLFGPRSSRGGAMPARGEVKKKAHDAH